MFSPEVQVVDRSLGIAHVDVEGVQIDWSASCPAQNLPEVRQSVACDDMGVAIVGSHAGDVFRGLPRLAIGSIKVQIQQWLSISTEELTVVKLPMAGRATEV